MLPKKYIAFSIMFAWKAYVILKNKDPPKQKVLDLSRMDPNEFKTNGTFRVIDKNCTIKLHPNLEKDSVYIAVMVKSAPANFERREWTRSISFNNVPKQYGQVVFVFVIGKTDDRLVQEQIEEESKTYGDILQTSLPDGYRQLSYKSVSGLLWLSQNYPHARYIGSMDDDQVVNTDLLVDILEEQYPVHTKPDNDIFHCIQKFTNFSPNREDDQLGGKWAVTREDYPAEKWPPHCYGWFYLLDAELAANVGMAAADKESPFLFMDDVYITGILRERVSGARIGWLSKGKLSRWLLEVFSPCYAVNWFRFLLLQTVSYPRDFDTFHFGVCTTVEKIFNVTPCTPLT